MDTKSLKKIVGNINESKEREALREAERLIGQIVFNQNTIRELEKTNTKLREQLKALEVEQLDPTSILGI